MDSFTFVEINGMKISEANTAFCHLWNALNTTNDHKSKPSKISPKAALSALEGWFANPDPARKTTYVLTLSSPSLLRRLIDGECTASFSWTNWIKCCRNVKKFCTTSSTGLIRLIRGWSLLPLQTRWIYQRGK